MSQYNKSGSDNKNTYTKDLSFNFLTGDDKIEKGNGKLYQKNTGQT